MKPSPGSSCPRTKLAPYNQRGQIERKLVVTDHFFEKVSCIKAPTGMTNIKCKEAILTAEVM
jgi:hypothetical protein